jgi:hypothetical protein
MRAGKRTTTNAARKAAAAAKNAAASKTTKPAPKSTAAKGMQYIRHCLLYSYCVTLVYVCMLLQCQCS